MRGAFSVIAAAAVAACVTTPARMVATSGHARRAPVRAHLEQRAVGEQHRRHGGDLRGGGRRGDGEKKEN
jgi:starvation-inducible outer membrane lipoprotein